MPLAGKQVQRPESRSVSLDIRTLDTDGMHSEAYIAAVPRPYLPTVGDTSDAALIQAVTSQISTSPNRVDGLPTLSINCARSVQERPICTATQRMKITIAGLAEYRSWDNPMTSQS